MSFPAKCVAQPMSRTHVESPLVPALPLAIRRRSSFSVVSSLSYAPSTPDQPSAVRLFPLSSSSPAAVVIAVAVAAAVVAIILLPLSISNQPLAARLRQNRWHFTPVRHGNSVTARPAKTRPQPREFT
ncbi:hypothetical protein F4824DRAFT_503916 [Ustulina deusta]|nr:hypothetical protein F4824DRAFT_503916 [Ustulina deusta]